MRNTVLDMVFKIRIRNKTIDGDNPYKWKSKTSDKYFNNCKVIFFSFIGAFVTTLSTYQLPNFEKLLNEFKIIGINKIYCLSVNNTFVINAWAKNQNLKNIEVISDVSAGFTRQMGMLVKDNLGFGLKSWRYAALIDDKVIKKLWIEEEYGDNTSEDSYGESSHENILQDLKKLQKGSYDAIKYNRKVRYTIKR